MSVQSYLDIYVDADDVLRLLQSFEDAVSPTSLEIMLAGGVANVLRWRAQNRFRSEGDSASGKWAALRPATEQIREFFGYPRSHPINVRTGELKHFVTQTNGVVRPTADGAELTWPGPASGDLAEKFKVAQQGSRRGDNPWFRTARTPPRPVVAVDQADVADVLAAINLHFVEAMRTGGFAVLPGP